MATRTPHFNNCEQVWNYNGLEHVADKLSFIERDHRIKSGKWVPYYGQYIKKFCDIRLKDGEYVKNCWPNAGKFMAMDGSGVVVNGIDVFEMRYMTKAEQRWSLKTRRSGMTESPKGHVGAGSCHRCGGRCSCLPDYSAGICNDCGADQHSSPIL